MGLLSDHALTRAFSDPSAQRSFDDAGCCSVIYRTSEARTVFEDDEAIVEGGRRPEVEVDVDVQGREGGFQTRWTDLE